MQETTIKNLHRAALAAATELLGEATDEQARALETAVKGGAQIALELGHLPDPNFFALVLVEREGIRRRIVLQSWERATAH